MLLEMLDNLDSGYYRPANRDRVGQLSRTMCSYTCRSCCCDCDLPEVFGVEFLTQVIKAEDWNNCDFPVPQMIDLFPKNKYSFLQKPNYTDSLTTLGNTRNLKRRRNIDQIGFPPTHTVYFDDSDAERMETGNPADLAVPGPSSSTVRVENTEAAAEETPQRTSVECHTRTCLCCECQEKYGSLPLFAQVLDSQQQTAARDGNDTPQPQPSTSNDQTSLTPSSSKTQPFQCDICHKRFSHRGDYHKHIRIHSGDRPYTCAHCPLRFAHPSNRARHLRSHGTERPYHCQACNRKFYRKDKLDRHRLSNRCRKMNERQDKR